MCCDVINVGIPLVYIKDGFIDHKQFTSSIFILPFMHSIGNHALVDIKTIEKHPMIDYVLIFLLNFDMEKIKVFSKKKIRIPKKQLLICNYDLKKEASSVESKKKILD